MRMGENIKRLREEHGMTQEELGLKIGVQKSAIAKYECGRVQNIKRSTIQKMAEVFHVKPSELMGFTEEEQVAYEDGYNEAMRLMKKYSVLNDIMLAGGTLLEAEKDNETTIKLLEAYANALKAMNKKGEN